MTKRKRHEEFSPSGEILPLPGGYALKRARTRSREVRYGLVGPDGFWLATSVWENEGQARAFADAMQRAAASDVCQG